MFKSNFKGLIVFKILQYKYKKYIFFNYKACLKVNILGIKVGN